MSASSILCTKAVFHLGKLSAGNITGTDQAVFEIYADNWLNLRTGVVTALNYSDPKIRGDGVYSFDPKLGGQAAAGYGSRSYKQKVHFCRTRSSLYILCLLRMSKCNDSTL